ncbi:hypothetical protein RRG08_046088 [Elysia crispata]|uniref:Uncharacterized protein n=1 Tax=Elysia crispata TaxID=231223 RepID=A0AAE0Y4V0_9GAST|nr:hypothetical protein RRG08_046088 [Elysia crispata]
MRGTGIPVVVEEGCKQFNHSVSCANHSRNREILDNWAGFDDVLFGVYKNDQMVYRMIISGKSSSYANWFEAGGIINSSWDDLTTQTRLFFRMTGDSSSTTHHTATSFLQNDW